MNKQQVMEALARGYCSKENEYKVLDSFLIKAMADEIMKLEPQAEGERCECGNMLTHIYFCKRAVCYSKAPNEEKGSYLGIPDNMVEMYQNCMEKYFARHKDLPKIEELKPNFENKKLTQEQMLGETIGLCILKINELVVAFNTLSKKK